MGSVSGYRMASAFGSGVAFSLVSGMATGNKFQGAFTTGTLFALFQGAFYQVPCDFCSRFVTVLVI